MSCRFIVSEKNITKRLLHNTHFSPELNLFVSTQKDPLHQIIKPFYSGIRVELYYQAVLLTGWEKWDQFSRPKIHTPRDDHFNRNYSFITVFNRDDTIISRNYDNNLEPLLEDLNFHFFDENLPTSIFIPEGIFQTAYIIWGWQKG